MPCRKGAPGIGGLIERFEDGGMSPVLDSWIGCGRNLPIGAHDLQRVLGTPIVEDIAEQLVLSRGVTAERLAQMLPTVVDKLTPQGRVSDRGLGDVGQRMGRMARR